MGLDSFLYADKRLNNKSKVERRYIDYFNHSSLFNNIPDGTWIYVKRHDIPKMPTIRGQVGNIIFAKKDGDSYIVKTEAGYWRKANQIHAWFVDNCQNGVDNGDEVLVSESQLSDLLNDVCDVLGKKELSSYKLPTRAGFFFGSTNYDRNYYSILRYTRKILKSVLRNATLSNWELHYESSW